MTYPMSKNKFLRIISTPLRALTKARDFYVRSLTGVAARTHYSSSSVSSPFPRSKSSSSTAFSSSASSRRATDFGIDEDHSELVRAASVRSLGHKNETEMLIQQKLQQKKERNYVGLGKSSSLGMAIIEEEEEGEEGSVNLKMKKEMNKVSDVLYPRSKSYAVTGGPKL